MSRTAWTSDPVEAVLVRAAQDQYVQRTVARWRSQRIDLLLMPGFACPAPTRDKISELLGTSGFFVHCLKVPDSIALRTDSHSDTRVSYWFDSRSAMRVVLAQIRN